MPNQSRTQRVEKAIRQRLIDDPGCYLKETTDGLWLYNDLNVLIGRSTQHGTSYVSRP